jgi:predicted Zn-dependent peptidase
VAQDILSHTLDNGLVLVGERMASLESAAFTLLVPAGCGYDPDGRGGLASFVCEMVLRGAGQRDSRRFVEDLDNLGVERAESVSTAHTSFGGATLARNLLPALAIYADVLRRPRLPHEQLAAGREVLMQELRAVEDDPAHKVMQELRRNHYPRPWGRPSQGDAAGIAAIDIDDVRQAHARLYRPNGTILSVAGRFDWQAVRDEVERLLWEWAPSPVAEPASGSSGPPLAHLHHDSNQTQIGVAYRSVAYRDPEYLNAWAAVGVLSGGMSARLFTEVREKRGLCYSVYASLHSLRDRGSVLCYAGTTAERAQETLDVTLAELVRLAEGIEPHELARLKARIKSALVMQQESSASRSAAIARDWYHLGRGRTLDELAALVDGLSREGINRHLAEHPPQEFTIVTLGPAALEVPVAVS